MSKLKTNTIRHVDGSNDNITLDSSQNVTVEGVLKTDSLRHTGASSDAVTLASDGTCTVKATNNLSNRNVLANGAMQIYQRGSSTGIGSANETTFALDRWGLYTQNTGARFTMSQGDGPDGFQTSLKIACTTADTSLASNEEVYFSQKLEGYDTERFQKGTSGAKSYTLSFWAKSTKTGTYIVRLLGRDNTTSNVSKAYTVGDTNWNKYTVNFPADTDTNRKDNSDNGEALRVQFWLLGGSAVNTGTLQETWANSSDSNACPGQVNFADSTSNIFYITGVQLEVGDVATDFEHRSYGDELQRCLRYFFKLNVTDNIGPYFTQYVNSHKFVHMWYPVTMRIAPTPTVTYSAGSPIAYKLTTNHFKAYVSSAYDEANTYYITAAQFAAEL